MRKWPAADSFYTLRATFPILVMAGLGPAIHVFLVQKERNTWMPGTSPGMTVEKVTHQRAASPSLASVDLAAHKRDGALIDLSGIPGLDGCEVGLSRLVSCSRVPAVRL
jgi:hypothetical protein